MTTTGGKKPGKAGGAGHAGRKLAPAAKRALEEAEKRRREADAPPSQGEVGGRDGPEPTRYGDWEKDGILSDF